MTNSDWVEVRVVAPLAWHELVAEVLALGPCTSVAFGRPNLAVDAAPEGSDYVRTFYSAGDDGPELRERIAAALRSLADTTGDASLAELRPTFHPLPREDWATSWRKTWKPFRVGRLAVVTHDFARPLRASDVRLALEPAGAFGTGRHATTRQCLMALEERDLDGARVLDAGTGTGILAVASALLGAASAMGFDVDPRSEVEGAELAAANGVAERCRFLTGDFSVLGEGDREFDVVLANIYADVVQQEAANLAARLRPGGTFVFSGCLDRHGPDTARAIEHVGLEIRETRRRGRWLTFVGTNGSSRPSRERRR
ncbi:MAG: 50S ribosomal protein L11 methyltransferase [Planctomycetota bacterium]